MKTSEKEPSDYQAREALAQARNRIRELEKMFQEHHLSRAALRSNEADYRSLFVNSPVSLWEEDFSKVKEILDGLREQGVEDFEAHLKKHPELVEECARSIVIKEVNEATLQLYEAADKSELLGTLDKLMVPRSLDYFIAELVTLAAGATTFEGEIEHLTLKGQPKVLSVSLRLAPGHEQIWDKVYVSIVDITEKRKAETERLHREKLQGVVETAGAACHDLNQPLQTIIGQLDLLLLNLEPEQKRIRERVEVILREVERITEITRKLSRVTSVESTDYLQGEKILDIDRSSRE